MPPDRPTQPVGGNQFEMDGRGPSERALLVTCLVDHFRPETADAAVLLLAGLATRYVGAVGAILSLVDDGARRARCATSCAGERPNEHAPGPTASTSPVPECSATRCRAPGSC